MTGTVPIILEAQRINEQVIGGKPLLLTQFPIIEPMFPKVIVEGEEAASQQLKKAFLAEVSRISWHQIRQWSGTT